MDDNRQETIRDPGLDSLILIARLHGLPADSSQLRHQFGHADRPVATPDLLRAARSLGLKARAVSSGWERLSSTPLPAIARDRDGQFFLVAQIKDDKVLIQQPHEPQPVSLERSELESRWDGGLILLTRRAGQAGGERKFDFSWFIPAILKYQRLLLDVFVASFCLQLFALVTPLFFQVVIDKVLVHHGLTTLDVLAIGLLVVSAFDVVLGGLRTYVFSHTTSRMDVTLGADLFRHLLRLPLSYFEARRVGDTVARVRELDSIRRFITGSALTLVIDLLFTVVFFAVMYLYSPLLTFIVLGTIPLYALLAFFVTPVLRARLHEKFNRGAENQAFLVESVSGVQTLKAAGCHAWRAVAEQGLVTAPP